MEKKTPKRRIIGHGEAAFLIAEAGVNHNGDAALAHRLIDVAARAGADAVKFQTFSAERLVSRKAAKAAYQRQTTGAGGQFDMLKGLELPPGAWRELKAHADETDLLFLSTPFDEASADLLAGLGVALLKLGSGDLTNRPLIEHCANIGLPLILSTGMAERAEMTAALSWFRLAFQRGRVGEGIAGTAAGDNRRIAFEDGDRIGLLHCVSRYPAPLDSLNLRAIATMRNLTGVAVGFSDHSEGLEAVPLALASGACMIEKHFTSDRTLPGPDHRASLEPDELVELVSLARRTEKTLGHGRKEPHPLERDVREAARRSIVTARPIKRGARISEDDVVIHRPGSGLAPTRLEQLIGSRAKRDIPEGEPIQEEWIEYRDGAELRPTRPE